MVSSALDIGKKTQGAFDITLGPLIDAWGFDKTGRHINKPSAESIGITKPYVGLDKVTAENGGIQKADPRVRINLSGIAKVMPLIRLPHSLNKRVLSVSWWKLAEKLPLRE